MCVCVCVCACVYKVEKRKSVWNMLNAIAIIKIAVL